MSSRYTADLGEATRASDDGDHRKRRRNRTTHSCINCHTSKRKCDRKRPCQRCIQLGLTGLCVYEVGNPSTADDPNQDEVSRLQARIAELEGVIRELKNKPHPRWITEKESASDRFHTRRALHRRASQLAARRHQHLSPMTLIDDEDEDDSVDVKVETQATPEHLRSRFSDSASPQPHDSPSFTSSSQTIAAPQPQPTFSFTQALGTISPGYSVADEPRGGAGTGSATGAVGYAITPPLISPSFDMQSFPSSASLSSVSETGSPHAHGAQLLYAFSDHAGPEHGVQVAYAAAAQAAAAQEGSCTCLTNPVAMEAITNLHYQMQNAMRLLDDLPEHQHHHHHHHHAGTCTLYSRLAELDGLMQTTSRAHVPAHTRATYSLRSSNSEPSLKSPGATFAHPNVAVSSYSTHPSPATHTISLHQWDRLPVVDSFNRYFAQPHEAMSLHGAMAS